MIIYTHIYPPELEIKETTSTFASYYLDLLLSATNRSISTKWYEKYDYFDFRILTSLTFVVIYQSPTYLYAHKIRACYIHMVILQTERDYSQTCLWRKFTASKVEDLFSKMYSRYQELIQHYHTPLTFFSLPCSLTQGEVLGSLGVPPSVIMRATPLKQHEY